MEILQSTLEVYYDRHTILNLFSVDQDRGVCHQVASELRVQPTNDRCFLATIGPDTNIPLFKAILKFSWGEREMEEMKAEYKIYMHLSHLQGTVIPRCYGYFTGRTHSLAVGEPVKRVGCLILEYCWKDIVRSLSPEEYNRQIMAHMCKIHAAGVEHRDIDYRCPRHIVDYGMSPRIVNFSKARLHKCPGAIPAASNGQLMGMGATCPELVQLELNYGLRSGTRIVPQPRLEPLVNGR